MNNAELREYELKVCKLLRDDFPHYATKCLKIRTKLGDIEPLALNKVQLHIHQKLEEQKARTGKVRAIILKARQVGISTYIAARFFHRVTFSFGCECFILTHELKATNNLFKMAKRYYEHIPEFVKPPIKVSNAKELNFEKLDSGYQVGTAETKQTGRSSTIQLLHLSESAFYRNTDDLTTGLLQTVPDAKNTEIIYESTANGVGGFFHKLWQDAEAGLSEYIPIFIPWYWQEEYKKKVPLDFAATEEEAQLVRTYHLSLEQLAWRRSKIIELSTNGLDGEKRFWQEFPSCIVGKERVGTNKGILPIKDIICNYNTQNGVIKRQWCNGEKETIKLETSKGYTLECTCDHRIFIENNFIEANNCLGKNISLIPPKFADDIEVVKWESIPCLRNEVLIDEKMALFLGFFMGNGCFSGNELSISFNKNDRESIYIVDKICKELFSIELHFRKMTENGVELRSSATKKVKELFFVLGIIKYASWKHRETRRDICVPDCIWRSPKYIVKEFLKGLFDSDGFAGHRCARISFFSKHEQFTKDIQLLLLGFGIISTIRTRIKIGGSNKHKYTRRELSLKASSSKLFAKEIGFVSKRKNERCLIWLEPYKIGRTADLIVLKDEIVSITQLGKQLVYDIEIDDSSHVFDANGILVHNCAAEAFVLKGEDSFIPSDIVMRARTAIAEPVGPLIIGADIARFGDDRSVIIKRQGRVAFDMKTYVKKDTMEMVGILNTLIEECKPAIVFIDVSGIGAGVVDRLHELGHRDLVMGINFGSKPLDPKKYLNKRSELWGEMLKWLQDVPVKVPDYDELHADLCNIKYSYNSNSQLVMEKKDEMKKRGVRSPDVGDALALSFSLPSRALEELKRKGNDVTKSMARDLSDKLGAIKRSRK